MQLDTLILVINSKEGLLEDVFSDFYRDLPHAVKNHLIKRSYNDIENFKSTL